MKAEIATSIGLKKTIPYYKKIVGIFLIISLPTSFLFAQQNEGSLYKEYSTGRFIEILKPYQTGDYAVGIQAKGKLANVCTNFGQLASFHIFAPSLEWPAFGEGQDDQQQYGFGVDLIMGINRDVIESFQDPASNIISREWQPAAENLFSGKVTVSETDLTPIMATSDNKEIWPINDDNQPFWPGLFRQDKDSTVYKGEFTSERDLYCVYTDAGNDTQYGVRVEQTAYSFARSYAEDFLIYRFNIKNTSENTLQDLYPGMIIQFLIDFDNHDLINFIDSNNDGKKDLIYMWDQDNTPQEPWSKVGYIGLLVAKSPNDNGITNFHYFHDDFIPRTDENFWMLLASDTTGVPDTISARYFHGDDIHIDDVSLAPALDPEGQNRGGEISWSFSVGPVSLAPGDSMPLDIAIVCGENEQDLLDNVEWVWFLAGNAWNGSNPPSPPEVTAYEGDGKVTLVWDANSSENSRDNITGSKDFEGYKVYRSTDHGKTWGKEITNPHAEFDSFKPIAQFDLKNNISGYDPISNMYLGNNSGIQHTFVDTTVINGIEYWYTVTAYDCGDSINQVESLESALGLTVDETNVASALPSALPGNFKPGSVPSEGSVLKAIDGVTYGKEVSLEIIDPRQLRNRNYMLTFQENTPVYEGDILVDSIMTFTLKDADDTNTVLLLDCPLTDESEDNIPVVEGFRLTVKNCQNEISSAGWTKFANDSCNFDWYFDDHNIPNYYPAVVEGNADFKLVVTYDDSTLIKVETVGNPNADSVYVPIKVFDITDLSNPIDISANTILFDFEYWGAFPPGTFGAKGWDLVPGGKSFNRHPFMPYPDELFFISYPSDNPLLTDTCCVSVRTQNFDSMEVEIDDQPTIIYGIPPSDGDEYTLLTYKPFSGDVVYNFSTTAGSYGSIKKEDLEKIRVVPNPYFVTSSFNDEIMFTNLPNCCDIKIYNVAGDLIRSLYHKDDKGITFWDLKNDEGLAIAYGLYIYVVKTDGGEKQIGKFAVIK